jgi:hypothetical protein
VLDTITEAEAAQFAVGEDPSVRDTTTMMLMRG